MKIIFLTEGPFIKQHLKDFYIESLSKFYQVEKWSLKKISNKDFKLESEISYITILNTKDFISRVRGIKEQVFFISDLESHKYKNLFQVINDNIHTKIAYIQKGDLISDIINNNLFYKYFKLLYISFFRYRKYYDYIFLQPNSFCNVKGKNKINIHNIKYDEFILSKNNTDKIVNTKYAVFIDQNMPYHPDIIKHWGMESINDNKYFKLLNNFFEKIEVKYNLQVIISAHPKSNYSDKCFNNRMIIKHKTPELINGSEFVILHSSTSFSNVVLEKKPMFFIYYEEMLNKGTRSWTLATIKLSEKTNSQLIDLEKIRSLDLKYCQESFDSFINSFLINEKFYNLTNSQIILNLLRKLEK